MNRICDLIIKTIITVQPQLAHVYRSSQPDDFENSMVFELLGFDVLLDYKLRPFLLEVNHSPSFTTDTPLDQRIKRGLIRDAITLLNLNPQRKEEYKRRKAEELQQRVLTGKKLPVFAGERDRLRREFEKERHKFELANLGNFRMIYPKPHAEEHEPDGYRKYLDSSVYLWEEFTTGNKYKKHKERQEKEQQIQQEKKRLHKLLTQRREAGANLKSKQSESRPNGTAAQRGNCLEHGVLGEEASTIAGNTSKGDAGESCTCPPETPAPN